MKNPNTHLSSAGKVVIIALRSTAGSYELYDKTLKRLSDLILAQGEDLAMEDMEILRTLRVLGLLREDLKDLLEEPAEAESASQDVEPAAEDPEEDAEDNPADEAEEPIRAETRAIPIAKLDEIALMLTSLGNVIKSL